MANLTPWAELVKSLSDTYRKWLDTRNAAYERKRDKRQVKAIEYGEKFILTSEDDSLSTEEKISRLKRYKNKFFKYN